MLLSKGWELHNIDAIIDIYTDISILDSARFFILDTGTEREIVK